MLSNFVRPVPFDIWIMVGKETAVDLQEDMGSISFVKLILLKFNMIFACFNSAIFQVPRCHDSHVCGDHSLSMCPLLLLRPHSCADDTPIGEFPWQHRTSSASASCSRGVGCPGWSRLCPIPVYISMTQPIVFLSSYAQHLLRKYPNWSAQSAQSN